jgi:hypothetical protein
LIKFWRLNGFAKVIEWLVADKIENNGWAIPSFNKNCCRILGSLLRNKREAPA